MRGCWLDADCWPRGKPECEAKITGPEEERGNEDRENLFLAAEKVLRWLFNRIYCFFPAVRLH